MRTFCCHASLAFQSTETRRLSDRSVRRASCHLELRADSGAPGHTLDLALATASAYGAAVSRAIRVDPRRQGKVASSKGTLSK